MFITFKYIFRSSSIFYFLKGWEANLHNLIFIYNSQTIRNFTGCIRFHGNWTYFILFTSAGNGIRKSTCRSGKVGMGAASNDEVLGRSVPNTQNWWFKELCHWVSEQLQIPLKQGTFNMRELVKFYWGAWKIFAYWWLKKNCAFKHQNIKYPVCKEMPIIFKAL